jgi:hypothetical protein
MEESVGYDGGNPVDQANIAVAHAIATRAGPAPADHFEDQAQATLSQWAALRRALERANEVIDQLRKENAESIARVDELVRANAQLAANLSDSQVREGEAKEQAGWLKGIMTAAAGTLMEGIGVRAGETMSHDTMLHRLTRRRSSQ